jgi:uncharacterized membrane protein YadS
MTTLSLAAWPALGRTLFPGVLASAVVAAAATFLSQHYGAPVMLFALLLGMAMNFLAADGPCARGIEFSARQVLRIGVALLGLRVTVAQIEALGWHPVLLVVASVALTIAVSMLAARALGFSSLFGLLSGGATAICGASAALALATALPHHPQKERATLFTVVTVSALSTLAMIAYPIQQAHHRRCPLCQCQQPGRQLPLERAQYRCGRPRRRALVSGEHQQFLPQQDKHFLRQCGLA